MNEPKDISENSFKSESDFIESESESIIIIKEVEVPGPET